ncbi:hypothetical protein [Tenacibaculum finnmarkense]|uniref:hypothetical protein n=1 Tax=Tenacibaculum finnmarkense TaxID=2781243 RepID=UPI001EFADE2E|nr:hypothetical protein [Tenacibaculum finnmarkense]MCG8208845.1 hypothetical protein [Tenacibaculum finnmarkense genomovar finnmarkense]MCG8224416.1 hypothetical protein [Tenacibaculum finnmarkense genomovar finnmarkense]MCG8247940.1 hypothetical protein [Tenacibaculum finnmarkense genomovar finnmarkense]MCG8714001.1 hypothetical protein [Tenacibaculum finnmarkense]MCG8737069.1 hypothetical protein [Tenacibaculum finnmarkense]
MTTNRRFPKGAISQIATEFNLSSNTISSVVNGRRTNKKQKEILQRLSEITENHQKEKRAKEMELKKLRANYNEVVNS